jgi:glycosyltransferase involved in cell wall biosynthesis
MIKVGLFFRKRSPQFNSIEELFSVISNGLSNSVKVVDIILPHERITFKNVVDNIRFARKNSKEISHITGHVHYLAIGLSGNIVLTIHDIGSSLKGNWAHRLFITIFWYWIPALYVKKITVISEFSKQELSRLIPFAKHKIKVIYNPIKEELKYIPKKFNVTNPKILLIGTKENKNLENTVKALKGISCQLHIIGKLSQEQESLLKTLKIDYINEFFIPYSDIIRAYENCDIVSFVSNYEGFGMPIIEGQAIGRLILTSNFGAMKEVAGDGACLVDPYSISSIRNGMAKLISNDTYRAELIQKGLANVERFKLDKIARDYLNVYRDIDPNIRLNDS